MLLKKGLFKNMITYFRMKKNEWKIKSILYSSIVAFMNNQKEILELIHKLYTVLKDVPAEDLQKEFISKLAEIIHEENKDRTE